MANSHAQTKFKNPKPHIATADMSKARRFWYDIKSSKNLYILMAPFMILFFTFTILPVLISIFFSFTNYNVLQAPDFVGLSNYERLFLQDDVFLKAVQNTFIIAIFVGPVGYMLSFVMAWLLNELPPKIRAILTVIFYAPSIAGNVYLIWTLIFSGDSYGFINGFLLDAGFITQPIQWLKEEGIMLWVVIIVQLWLSLGVGFLSFIAGLQGIDNSLIEAGSIDGIKNRWQELWYVILPQMKPMLMFGAVMAITSAFSVADVTVALTGFPSPNYGAHTIVNHLNDYGLIRMELGYASAIAVILFLVMVLSNLLVQNFLKRVGK